MSAMTWMTDEALAVAEAPAPRGRAQLMARLLEAQDSGERQQVVRGMLHTLGFEWLAYGTVRLHMDVPEPRLFFSTYANPGWADTYFGHRLYEVDFRHRDASPSGLPRVWELDEVVHRSTALTLGPGHRRFAEQLHASGMRSGVFMSLPSTAGPQERTVISLSSSSAQRGWIVDSVLGQAVMLALCLHEFLGARLPAAAGAAPSQEALSPMQREILRGLALGQSDKEIAYRLNLSAHTVDYHMRRLRQRFAVRNRVQLVHAAARGSAGAALAGGS
jgi:DNA-binding CsgD family transcriptional regulator